MRFLSLIDQDEQGNNLFRRCPGFHGPACCRAIPRQALDHDNGTDHYRGVQMIMEGDRLSFFLPSRTVLYISADWAHGRYFWRQSQRVDLQVNLQMRPLRLGLVFEEEIFQQKSQQRTYILTRMLEQSECINVINLFSKNQS